MALSGSNTGALRPYTAQNLLEEACSRAGIPPELITAEIVQKALDQFNLVLTSLVNRGIQLWKRQSLILPLYESVNQVPLPPGFNLITTLNRRTLFRQASGTAFTDAGGTASLAFDDDFDTACTQTSNNGSIGMHFSAATVVSNVGVLSGTAGTWALSVEWSNDGTNYTSVGTNNVTFDAADQWVWFDLSGWPTAGALYWRCRSTGSTPFSVAELYFGNTPQEIYLGPWNLDDFSNMPNKAQGGQVVNYYQQRNVSVPILYVWPTPDRNSRYDTLACWGTQYMDQVTSITQSLDFPLRWYDAVTAMMARRLCISLKEADVKRYEMLKNEEMEAVSLAQAEERDPAPVNYDMGVQVYTA